MYLYPQSTTSHLICGFYGSMFTAWVAMTRSVFTCYVINTHDHLTLIQVTKQKKWSDIGRVLGYGGVPGLSTQLKNSYTRVVLPFEQFSDRVKNLTSTLPTSHELKTHSNIQSAKSATAGSSTRTNDASPPSSPLTTTSSPLSEPPDESDLKDRSSNSKQRRSTRTGSQEQQIRGYYPIFMQSRLLIVPNSHTQEA